MRALWFSDIEGSTQLLLRLGDDYETVLARHRAIVREAFARAGADEQGTEGDSFFALFPTASAAVAAAVEVQQRLAAEPWPDDTSVRVRIGLHLGEIVQHPNGDVTGIAVHLAARVMASGHGGQIVITDTIRAHLDPQLETIDLGSHQLSDIPTLVHLHQVCSSDLAHAFPPLRTAATQHSVPLPPLSAPLIGRQREIDGARVELEATRLLSFVGTPGCGKTRLATDLGHRVAPNFDLVAFVDLTGVELPDLVAGTVARASGVAAGGDPIDGAASLIGERSALLVIDNCEHVLDASRTVIRALLDRCQNVRVIATSQMPLDLHDEVVLSVGGLEPSGEEEAPGRALLLDRARALGVDLADLDLDAVDALVGRLDGIPLAIELAASLTPALTPAEIEARLADRFALLASGAQGHNPRHRTLLTAVDWGFRMLTESDRKVVSRLAVCTATFSLAAAEALTADLDIGPVIPALNRLVRASWLVRSKGVTGSRYRMLESLREYALRNLDEDARRIAGDAHGRHYLSLYSPGVLGEDAPRDGSQFIEIDEEIHNITAALHRAVETKRHLDAAAETFIALRGYWQARPSWREPFELLNALLRASGTTLPPGMEAELLVSKAFYEMMLTNNDARIPLAEALEALERSPTTRARLGWLHTSIQVHAGRGDGARAKELAEALIAEAAAADAASLLQSGYFRRGLLRWETESWEAFREDLISCVATKAANPNHAVIAFALCRLATIADVVGGDRDRAIELADEAAVAATRSDHRVAEIVARETRAAVSGDRAFYRKELDELIVLARQLGTLHLESRLQQAAALEALRVGEADEALRRLEEADAIPTSDPADWGASIIRAAVYRAGDRRHEAAAELRATLREISDRSLISPAWNVLYVLAAWGEASSDPALNNTVLSAAAQALDIYAPWMHLDFVARPRADVPRDTASIDLADAVRIATSD